MSNIATIRTATDNKLSQGIAQPPIGINIIPARNSASPLCNFSYSIVIHPAALTFLMLTAETATNPRRGKPLITVPKTSTSSPTSRLSCDLVSSFHLFLDLAYLPIPGA